MGGGAKLMGFRSGFHLTSSSSGSYLKTCFCFVCFGSAAQGIWGCIVGLWGTILGGGHMFCQA